MRSPTTGWPSPGRNATCSTPISPAPINSAPLFRDAEPMPNEARIAVLVPCYNEEAAIGKVVRDFRAALPKAVVYVYDNASKDRTSEVALEAGAQVRAELRRGKGNVVRRMFADIEADIYVLVDGDDTYDASAAPTLIARLVHDGLDIVAGRREATGTTSYRFGHVLGNRLLTGL